MISCVFWSRSAIISNNTWYIIEQPQQGLVHNRPGSDLLLFTAQNTLAQNRSQRGVGVGSALKIPPHLNIASGDSGLVLNEIQVFPLNIGQIACFAHSLTATRSVPVVESGVQAQREASAATRFRSKCCFTGDGDVHTVPVTIVQ